LLILLIWINNGDFQRSVCFSLLKWSFDSLKKTNKGTIIVLLINR